MKKHAYTTKHKVLTGIAVVGLAAALTVPFVAYGADAPALGWGVAGSRACGTSCAGADGNGACNSFADTNGDGVCDNRGIHAACSAFSRGFAAFGECGRALGANFVDEDGEGLCDHREAGLGFGNGNAYGADAVAKGDQGAWCASCGFGFVDENGDGVCDHAGTGNGNCSGYVDENGDGACDNAGSCAGSGQGAGYGSGHGSGNGGGHHGMCAR